MFWFISLLCCFLDLGKPALAEENFIPKMQLSLENQTLIIQLQSPLTSLLGEQPPTQEDEQLEPVKQLSGLLQQPRALINIPLAAHCKIESVSMGAPVWIAADSPDPQQDDHKNSTTEQGYMGLSARYELLCTEASELNSLRINVFNVFPKLKSIMVETNSYNGTQHQLVTPLNTQVSW